MFDYKETTFNFNLRDIREEKTCFDGREHLLLCYNKLILLNQRIVILANGIEDVSSNGNNFFVMRKDGLYRVDPKKLELIRVGLEKECQEEIEDPKCEIFLIGKFIISVNIYKGEIAVYDCSGRILNRVSIRDLMIMFRKDIFIEDIEGNPCIIIDDKLVNLLENDLLSHNSKLTLQTILSISMEEGIFIFLNQSGLMNIVFRNGEKITLQYVEKIFKVFRQKDGLIIHLKIYGKEALLIIKNGKKKCLFYLPKASVDELRFASMTEEEDKIILIATSEFKKLIMPSFLLILFDLKNLQALEELSIPNMILDKSNLVASRLVFSSFDNTLFII